MLAVVLVAVVIAVIAHLVAVVRSDRSLIVPRSHTHELDPQTARLFRVV